MRTAIGPLFVIGSLAWLGGGPAVAQDVGAIVSGSWDNAAIWTTGNVPGSSSNVAIGSTYPSGAASTATVTIQAANESANNVYLGYGAGTNGTLVLDGSQGHGKLTVARDIQIGTAASGGTTGGIGTIQEVAGGSFQALSVQIRSGNSLTFGANDVAGSLLVAGGSSATTTATGNVTTSVILGGGGTLNMGADLNITGPNLSGTLTNVGAGSIVHMNGHSIAADVLVLGGPGALVAGSVDRGAGGTLNLVGLASYNGTFDLAASDKVQALESIGGTLTTAATGNVTVDLLVAGGGTIKLGADLLLNQTNSSLTASQQVSVQDSGSVLDAQGHSITADSFLVGQNGTSAVSVLNLGTVSVNTLEVGNGSTLALHGGDTIGSSISLSNGSTLDVRQVGGTGLTLNGTSSTDLSLLNSSHLDLLFSSSAATASWGLRWADPSGGNWIGTLESMIADGSIKIDMPAGDSYSVYDQGGYTYIGVTGAAVPEPSTLVMGLLAFGVLATAGAWRRRRGR